MGVFTFGDNSDKVPVEPHKTNKVDSIRQLNYNEHIQFMPFGIVSDSIERKT